MQNYEHFTLSDNGHLNCLVQAHKNTARFVKKIHSWVLLLAKKIRNVFFK